MDMARYWFFSLLCTLFIVGCAHEETPTPADGLPEMADTAGAMEPLNADVAPESTESRKEAMPSATAAAAPLPYESNLSPAPRVAKRSHKAKRKHKAKKRLAKTKHGKKKKSVAKHRRPSNPFGE
jgi:hypothetical protein